jgi:hypothetical protein
VYASELCLIKDAGPAAFPAAMKLKLASLDVTAMMLS